MYPDAIVQKLGQISLAHDWHEALRSGYNSIWVSGAVQNQKTLHGEICVKYGAGGPELECSDGFEASLINKNVLMVKCNTLRVTSYFFAPYNIFANVHDKAVRCLDISPGGGLAVSCGDDGGLYVWQTDNGNIRRTLEGHITDVSQCRFFPSGAVVLSGGNDMRLKIWSVEDGSCPITLVGHKGAITETAIIDRGRNIISCSRDGSAALWNCGTAECLWKTSDSSSVVNCCDISQYKCQGDENTVVGNNEKECGTEGKLLILGRENGYLEGFDLYSKTKVFSVACHSAINDCCFADENNIVAGLQDGKIIHFDVRNTSSPRRICQYGKTSVNCVKTFLGESTLVGRGDGSCSCIRNLEMPDIITMELGGPNCDPIFDVTCHENFVYTSCRDSNVRKYKLDLNG